MTETDWTTLPGGEGGKGGRERERERKEGEREREEVRKKQRERDELTPIKEVSVCCLKTH